MSGTSIDTPTDVAMASVPERSQENNDDSLVWGGSLYYNPRKKRPHKVLLCPFTLYLRMYLSR